MFVFVNKQIVFVKKSTGGGGGLCSLLLSLLSDPSGSSDSLHSGSPSVRPKLLSLSLSLPPFLSVSVSRSPLRLLPPALSCCLVSFHRSQQRSRRVEGSALFACHNPRTAAYESARSSAAAAWTRVPPPPLRRGRPRPDTLFSGHRKHAQKKKPHTTKSAACCGRVGRPGRCCCCCSCCCREASWASGERL